MSAMPAAPEPSPSAAPYMWCSDCRAPMRDRYYALNERPICATCRPAYVAKIARTDGKGAMWRIGLHGAAVAGIGAVVLAIVTSAVVPLGIIFFVPIGYFIGKRMMRALDGYSARSYQYVAVSLTYLSILVGMGTPSLIRARREYARGAATEAETRAKMSGVARPTQEELAAPAPAQPDLEPAAVADEPESEPTAAADESDAEPSDDVKPPAREPADIGPGPGLAFAMFLLMPIVAQLQFGIGLASTAMLSILVALYQAWTRTDGQGMHLTLRGPFRVGQGPIAAR